ncbi:hypothetical protein [Flavobacterium sp.]
MPKQKQEETGDQRKMVTDLFLWALTRGVAAKTRPAVAEKLFNAV